LEQPHWSIGLHLTTIKANKLHCSIKPPVEPLIHLRLAQIHPFRDGNGRAARLIEKWFVAEKLG
jgi:Fic family protein